MNWKDFFKPSIFKIILFIIIAFLLYWFFIAYNTEIFPCKTQPVVPNPPPSTDSICALTPKEGASQKLTIFGNFIEFILFIVFPYLIACIIKLLIKRK